MSKPFLSEDRYNEVGEIISQYLISHDDCVTNDDLMESFKHIGSRVDELSSATGLSKDEILSFGWTMVHQMVSNSDEE